MDTLATRVGEAVQRQQRQIWATAASADAYSHNPGRKRMHETSKDKVGEGDDGNDDEDLYEDDLDALGLLVVPQDERIMIARNILQLHEPLLPVHLRSNSYANELYRKACVRKSVLTDIIIREGDDGDCSYAAWFSLAVIMLYESRIDMVRAWKWVDFIASVNRKIDPARRKRRHKARKYKVDASRASLVSDAVPECRGAFPFGGTDDPISSKEESPEYRQFALESVKEYSELG